MRVLHIGSLANPAGGIARVAHQWAAWDLPDVRQDVLATTRGGGRLSDLRLAARACRVVLRGRRDGLVVHAHLAQEGMWREGLVLWWARLWGVPVVVHLHGSRFGAYARDHARLLGVVLRAASAVLCLTGEAQRIVGRLRPDVPTHLVHNYQDVVPELAPGQQRAVFAGAVGRRKGVDVLLEAWRRLPGDLVASGWTLVVCGPVETGFRAELEEIAAPAGVTLAGSLPHEEVEALLAGASLAVLPSRAEAFPMFLLEGMAHGAIPVVTDVGDVARLVGETGWVCPPGDVDALTAALVEASALEPGERERRRRTARARVVSQWSLDRLQPLVLEVWRSVLVARSGSPRP